MVVGGLIGRGTRRATIAAVGQPEFFDEDEGGAAVSRFDALETNNDGRIEWYEWPGSWESFEAQDFDRNGVLTWGELLPSGGTGSPAAVTIELDPRQRWGDTGMWVSTGDSLTINATGVAQLSTNPNDIAWPSGSRSGRRAPDAPLRDERAGTLIARIGDSATILIGEHRSIVAPTGGFLYLGVNDDYLADNAGEFQVQIFVRPRY